MARRSRDPFGVVCTAVAAPVALVPWLLLGTGVRSATTPDAPVAAQRPGESIVPKPLPPLTAPQPPPLIPPPINVAEARGVLHRAKRLYVAPSKSPKTRRALLGELRSWHRFKIVATRRDADLAMMVGQFTALRGFVGAEGVTTDLPPVSEVALIVRDATHVLWHGMGTTVSIALAAFRSEVAAADGGNAK